MSEDRELIISVSGYRDFYDYEYVCSVLSQYKITEIHVGDCRGTDDLVRRYAEEHNIKCNVFYADWSKGVAAGAIRNRELIKNTNLLVAFLSDKSKGTKSAIQIAQKLKIPVKIYEI